jgi:hypothetical protein
MERSARCVDDLQAIRRSKREDCGTIPDITHEETAGLQMPRDRLHRGGHVRVCRLISEYGKQHEHRIKSLAEIEPADIAFEEFRSSFSCDVFRARQLEHMRRAIHSGHQVAALSE